MSSFDTLLTYLSNVDGQVLAYLETSHSAPRLNPPHLQVLVWSYLRRPAKRLRPALLLMACGAVGGDPAAALPAASGVELFHTWTLVHDDIIDDDSLRRGHPTVHVAARQIGANLFGLEDADALTYGRNLAILTGDALTGWATASFAESGMNGSIDPLVILHLLHHLQSGVVGLLLSGETLDVEFGLSREDGISEEKILDMLWLKTGALCEFAGQAGAMIGLNTTDMDDELVQAIAYFAGRCGTAFQLQDDIIGILGDESDTGKPVGSDIVEGKLTVIALEALKNADEAQRAELLSVLGNKKATRVQINRATHLMQDLGGVERATRLAREYVEGAMPMLDNLAASESRDLLESWAAFMVDRKF